MKGRVTDAVTGLPVVNAKVTAGRSDTTNANGEFEISDAWGYGWLYVEVSRTGYGEWSSRLAAGEHPSVAIQLQPGPVVQIRRTNNATHTVDFDSVKFGFSTGFSRVEGPFEDFCAGDGTTFRHDRSEMKRIVGPATQVSAPSCCSQAGTWKIAIELRGKPLADFLFADSCSTPNPMSISAREHVSGEMIYVPIDEISEVTFP